MQYGKILKRALQVTWHNRILWLFGIVVALFGVGVTRARGLGGLNLRLNGLELPSWLRFFPQNPPPSISTSPAVYYSATQNPLYAALPGLVFATSLVLSLLAIVVFVVGLVARYTSLGALIGMVDDIEQRDRSTLKVGFTAGWRSWLRLVAIDLIIALSYFVLFFVIALIVFLGIIIGVLPWRMLYHPSMGQNASAFGGIWGIFVALGLGVMLVIVLLASAGLTTLVRELAYREVVLENKNVFSALDQAIREVGRKLGQLGVVWLLLFGMDLAFGLVTLPLTIIGGIAVTAPFDMITRPAHPTLAGFLLAIPLLLVIALVGLFLNGVFVTFRSTVWTLAYREVSEPLAETT
ncbi:MAG: hypothetical protein ACYCZF_03050 [Anaerolineae bacterium]